MDLKQYFQHLEEIDDFSKKSNQEYFESLWEKYQKDKSVELKIYEPERNIESNIFPAAVLDSGELPVTEYEDLKGISKNLAHYNLILCKMHAGIGSSVKRKNYLKEITGREKLGAKGTDLFIKVDGVHKSLAQLQFEQARILDQSRLFKNVKVQNLVNLETKKEMERLDASGVNLLDNLIQLKVPTILNDELTLARKAPAGHAYLGFTLLSKLFEASDTDDIFVIGNGEDLNSTADEKILSWIVDHEIPVTMITTTKLAKDKKGGQISLVKADSGNYVTIIEKAQAEKAGQLEYFEALGLRKKDNKALFNTNIVVINGKALCKKLQKLNLNFSEFKNIIAPDLIKNTKVQDGKNFIQLEGAIGSTMLNLDKFFRVHLGESVLSFLNLDPKAREHFFIPIKSMDDFNEILERYEYNKESGRLDLKE